VSFFDVTADPDSQYYIGPLGNEVPSGEEIRAEVTKQVDDEIAKGWLGDVVTPLARDQEIQDRYEDRIANARQGLDEHVDVRDPGTPPSTLWENASHQQMIDAVTQQADSAAVAVTSEEWVSLGNELTEHQRNLADAIEDSLSDWQGSGGDAAREHLASVGRWLGSTAKGATLTGRQQEIHSQSLNETQKQMAANPPVRFDTQAANAQLQTITDPVQFAQQAAQYQQTQQQQEAARQQAARIMTQYDDTIGGAIATAAFPAPPKLAAAGSATTGGTAASNTASPMLSAVKAQGLAATSQGTAAVPDSATLAGAGSVSGAVGAAGTGGASVPGGGLAAASAGDTPGVDSGTLGSAGSYGSGGSAGIGGTSGSGGRSIGSGSYTPSSTGGIPGLSESESSYQAVPLSGTTSASSTGFGTSTGSIPTIGYSGGINGDSIASRLGGTSGSYDPTGLGTSGLSTPPLTGTTGAGGSALGKGVGGIGESGSGKGVGGAGFKTGAGGSAAAGRLAAGASSGAAAAEEAAAARAAGASGTGRAGATTGGAPMAHGGKQAGGEDKEHRVADYLEGDPELFEGDQVIAPPVIGDWKNNKKSKK